MLPAPNRARHRAEFAAALRGRRVRVGALVLHYGVLADATSCKAAVITSRAVGPAVVRNRVRRRLRHQLVPLLPQLPPGSVLLVRALPDAAGWSGGALAEALRSGVSRLTEGPGR